MKTEEHPSHGAREQCQCGEPLRVYRCNPKDTEDIVLWCTHCDESCNQGAMKCPQCKTMQWVHRKGESLG